MQGLGYWVNKNFTHIKKREVPTSPAVKMEIVEPANPPTHMEKLNSVKKQIEKSEKLLQKKQRSIDDKIKLMHMHAHKSPMSRNEGVNLRDTKNSSFYT